MKKLDLSKLVNNMSSTRDATLASSLQFPVDNESFYGSNELIPIKYNPISNGTVWYDGTNAITLTNNKFSYNGTEVFSPSPNHFVINECTAPYNSNVYTINSSNYAQMAGDTLTVVVAGAKYTVSALSPSYDFTVIMCPYGSGHYIVTLLPSTTTPVASIISVEAASTGIITSTSNNYAVMVAGSPNYIYCDGVSMKLNGNRSLISAANSKLKLGGDRFHISVSGKAASGAFYSNFCFYDKWLQTDGMILATDAAGDYEGGYKCDFGSYSIDYYNHNIVSVAYNNKSLVTSIDDAYYDGTIKVRYQSKWYAVTIATGLSYQIVGDLIVANTIDYNNTYDIKSGEAFCRNDDYNGRVLWCIDDAAVPSDMDLALSKYCATAVNAQAQVYGGIAQGTLWPAFNIYGLAKGGNYSLLDFWNDTARIPVEVYNATDDALTTPVYRFTLGGSNNYSGVSYADSSNTEYSISELDTLTNTGSDYLLITTPWFTALSALNNKQAPVLSYYIGTMSELKSTFVIQGTIYGITSSGYIVSMTVSDGAISSTTVVTKVGYLTYIGSTSDTAYFYDSVDKALYQFTSTLKLEKVMDLSISVPRMIASQPENNKVAIACDDGIYAIDGASISHIPVVSNDVRYSYGYLIAGTNAYSKYDGQTMPVILDTGNVCDGINSEIMINEVLVNLDTTGVNMPYIEYNISVNGEAGETKSIDNISSGYCQLKPTSTRTNGLFYRIKLKTNCSIIAVAVDDGVKERPSLAKVNG